MGNGNPELGVCYCKTEGVSDEMEQALWAQLFELLEIEDAGRTEITKLAILQRNNELV